MTKDLTNYTIDDLIKKCSAYIDNEEEIDKIKRAYLYALDKHSGQYRRSGEPYIYHPLCTAIILTTVSADCDTICAGLLHDVIEDCGVTKGELEEKFGLDFNSIAEGLSE